MRERSKWKNEYMFLGIILSFLLIFSVAAAGLWYHIEWLYQTAVYSTMHMKERLLVEGLVSYGMARLKNDVHSRINTEDMVVVKVPSWPSDASASKTSYSAQLVFTRQDRLYCNLLATLYKKERIVEEAHFKIPYVFEKDAGAVFDVHKAAGDR